MIFIRLNRMRTEGHSCISMKMWKDSRMTPNTQAFLPAIIVDGILEGIRLLKEWEPPTGASLPARPGG